MQCKKFISLILSSLVFFFNTSFAMAVNFTDVGSEYWAFKEIQAMSDMGVISGYPDNTFKPDNPVNRAEFTSMVIKTLNKEEMSFCGELGFTDLNEDFWAYSNILRSKELGLIVGYPDKTFKPCNLITKSEATSIISKTVKDCEKPCNAGSCPVNGMQGCVLKQFADKEEIAGWAKPSFVKAVKNDLYVNYPDENYLTPNKDLTRAETAVLLYKIRQNPCIVLKEYQGPALVEASQVNKQEPVVQKLMAEENKTVIEHLPTTPYTGSINEVEISGSAAKILAENIFSVRFEDGLNSKNVKQGDTVYLVFDNDVITEEGTTIIPAGSKLAAELTKLKRGKPFHLNGEAELTIKSLITLSGKTYPLSATIINDELLDPGFGKCNLKRAGTVAGSVAAFGTLLGLTVSSGGDIGEGTAAGAIIGGSIGVLLGLIAPGCGVNIPAEEQIYVKVNNDTNLHLE